MKAPSDGPEWVGSIGATTLLVPSQTRMPNARSMSNQSHLYRKSLTPELCMAPLAAAMAKMLLVPIVLIALIPGERIVLVVT